MRTIVLLMFMLWAPVIALADPITGRATVVDGDTLKIGESRIRLFGIDAPEQDQTCVSLDGDEWPCGLWVTEQVVEMVNGRSVSCTPREIDQYGRVVASCTLNDMDIGQELVASGLAFAYPRYSMDYDLDEKAAAVRNAGLHAHRIQSPAAFRRARTDTQTRVNGACVIKGNISRTGARIYHRPGQKDYARTTIRPEQGERWFCSEAEAQAAGWRPARR